MKIAVDLNGGDQGPKTVALGIKLALRQGFIQPQEITILGTSIALDLIRPMHKLRQIETIECSQEIEMEDGLREILKKKNSTMSAGIQGVRDKQFNAFVSAGSTAGMVALGCTTLGLIKPKLKPAIAIPLPNLVGPCLLVDAGASPLAGPSDLMHFGWMGGIYTREVWEIPSPKIGLLNVGSEPTKGDKTLQEAHQLLVRLAETSGLEFVGNVEGDGILTKDINVVVCNGMVGNTILKFGESIYQALLQKFGLVLQIARLATRFHKKADYQRTGGAPLLGVNGILIIAHGKSSAKVIANAIRIAVHEAQSQVNETIAKEINHDKSP